MRLLVTRVLADAEHTALALRARGHDVLLAPVLRVEPVIEADIPARSWGAILMTSVNAARAIAVHPQGGSLKGVPLFAVGRQTARAAAAAGFTDIVSADGNAADLVDCVTARLGRSHAPLLYLAGEHRSGDVAGDLGSHGLTVGTVVIYRTLAATTLSDAAREALSANAIDAILHFSRRSAVIALDCAKAAGLTENILRVRHYCLSANVAEPLRAAGAPDIRIARHPDETALLELVGSA